MAAILLAPLAASIGASVGGTVLGISAAAIGQAAGAVVGSLIDNFLISALQPTQKVKGQRVETLQVAGPREGQALERGRGRIRVPGRIIWPERVEFENVATVTRTVGKGPAAPATETTTYSATVTLAIAVCEGPILLWGRVYADGNQIKLTEQCAAVRWYKGFGNQDPDPLIEEALGAGFAPDWRGIAYIVVEDWDLSSYGNRIPQLNIEVIRDIDVLPHQGVALGPGTGEFAYSPGVVERGKAVKDRFVANGTENAHVDDRIGDFLISVAEADATCPDLQRVTLPVAWFGSDLRCDVCDIRPKVELANKRTSVDWIVQGLGRGDVPVVTSYGTKPAFTGTPSDRSIIMAIRNLKDRGYAVTLLPLLLMDIPAGNTLPAPDGSASQPKYPWRGDLTCNPGIGAPGSVDGTADARVQMRRFFGDATADDFVIGPETVTYTGPAEWSYRRFVLHIAALGRVGGIEVADMVLLGSEMPGITHVRDETGAFPGVEELLALVQEIRVLHPSSTTERQIDFQGAGPDGQLPPQSEVNDPLVWALYALPFQSAATSSTGGVRFDNARGGLAPALDPLLVSNYFTPPGPLGYDPTYVGITIDLNELIGAAAVSAGAVVTVTLKIGRPAEGFAVFYPPSVARLFAVTGFAFGGVGEGVELATHENSASTALNTWEVATLVGVTPPGTRYVRLRCDLFPYACATDVRASTVADGERVEVTYAAHWQEYGAYLPDDGTGDVLWPLDPLWSDIEIDSVGLSWSAPVSDWRPGRTHLDAQSWRSVYDPAYLTANVAAGEYADWRYLTQADRRNQVRTPITDPGGHGEAWVYAPKRLADWWSNTHHNRIGGVRSSTPTNWSAEMKPCILALYQCNGAEFGGNAPGLSPDWKSSTSALPPHSSGARDDDSQRRALDALVGYWAADETGCVDLSRSCAWSWDVRPQKLFEQTNLWPDSIDWPTGPWISGRPYLILPRLAAREAEYHDITVGQGILVGAVEGLMISERSSFAEVLGPVSTLWQVSLVEREGAVWMSSRIAEPIAASPALIDLVPVSGDATWSRSRGDPERLPDVSLVTVIDAARDFSTRTAVAHRGRRWNRGEVQMSLPAVLDAQLADMRALAMLADAWMGLEEAEAALPPSALTTSRPGQILALDWPSGAREMVITGRKIGGEIGLSLREIDGEALRPPVTRARQLPAPRLTGNGEMLLAVLDLPLLGGALTLGRYGWAAIGGSPWTGGTLWRSVDGLTGWQVVGRAPVEAVMGQTLTALPEGAEALPLGGHGLDIDLAWPGQLVTPDSTALLSGAARFAVEGAAGWEIIDAGRATLVSQGVYRLRDILRGRRGTQAQAIPAGAWVIRIDDHLTPLGLEAEEASLPWWFGASPARRDISDIRAQVVEATLQSVALRPFAPAQLRSRRAAGGQAVLTWVRRDRAPEAELLDSQVLPLSEVAEAYDVVTFDAFGAEVASLRVTAPTATLTVARGTRVTVHQIATDGSRGLAAEITV
jgi:hypothetical protein